MKNIYLCGMLLIVLSACNKELVEHPKAIAAETFYNTPTEIESGLNAIYMPLESNNCLGALYPAQLETYSDYIYGRGSYNVLNSYQGLDNTNITRVGQMWQEFYQAIRNANLIIKFAPQAKSINQTLIDQYVAEAKFLRGFIYFCLVRNWGGVPLRTESNMDSINLKRSTVQETYALILSDLQYAESNLPDKPRLIGAPSKWAAKTVLADVYMNLQDYKNASEEALQVIQSGEFSLVPVSTAQDFQKIFGPEVITTPEEIWYLHFTNTVANFGWGYVMYAHAPGDGRDGAGGYYAFYTDTVQNVFIKNWDNNDLRKQYDWYPWNIGLGPNTELNSKFNDPSAVNANSAGNAYPLYRYADVLLFYAESDCRVNNGPTAQDMEALNEVHRRAYGYDSSQPSPVDFNINNYDESSFINLAVRERAYEDCFEAKRWLDLKRLGIAKTVIPENKGASSVADKMLLWPIPSVEYNYNKAIDPVKDQNPGY